MMLVMTSFFAFSISSSSGVDIGIGGLFLVLTIFVVGIDQLELYTNYSIWEMRYLIEYSQRYRCDL